MGLFVTGEKAVVSGFCLSQSLPLLCTSSSAGVGGHSKAGKVMTPVTSEWEGPLMWAAQVIKKKECQRGGLRQWEMGRGREIWCRKKWQSYWKRKACRWVFLESKGWVTVRFGDASTQGHLPVQQMLSGLAAGEGPDVHSSQAHILFFCF